MAVPQAPAALTVDSVGNAFVKLYYLVLHQSPEDVHRFYQDVSKLGRPGDNEVMGVASTMQAINEKILSLDYSEFRSEIINIDTQDSLNGGVLVLATGYLTRGDNLRRKFTQTFFLAPQEKGYFVLNDIFRYLDEPNDQDASNINDVEASLAPEPAVEEGILNALRMVDLSPTCLIGRLTGDNTVVALEEAIQEDVCNPSEAANDGLLVEKQAPTAEVVDETQNNVLLVGDEDVKDDGAPKKSYASIVKVIKDDAVNVATSSPVSSKIVIKIQDQPATVPSPTPAVPITEPHVLSSKVTENGNIQDGEADSHSVFLKGLPMNAFHTQIDNEFRRFGAIKSGGIQIRCRKFQGFCFGFVKFEERSSAQSAIEASPITIGGRQVVVEPKKSTSRGNSRERFMPGRGAGFGNDGGRGHGNFSGNRGGYGRREANNRGEFFYRVGGRVTQNRSNGYQRVERVGGNDGHVSRGGQSGWGFRCGQEYGTRGVCYRLKNSSF